MTKRNTEEDYKNLAKSLGLTWCGPDLPQNSKTDTNWTCSNPEHQEFEATYNDLLKIRRECKTSGCGYCSGKWPTKTNNFAVLHPELAKQWHPTKNKLEPTEVTPGSGRKIFWLCPVDLEHDRKHTVVYVVHRGIPKCRQCNTLAAKRPDLIPEWHPTKNGDLKPEDISYGNDEPVWWQCQFDPSHEWRASPGSRTSGQESGCPHCNKRASKLEIRVYTELLTLFPDALWGEAIHGKECDVLLPSISVGIEVDGGYYHGDKLEKDLAKNVHLKSYGIDTLRLREHPLPKIAEIDIQHKKNDRSLTLMKVIVQRLEEMRPEIGENTAVRGYLKRKKLAAVGHYRKEMAGLQSPPFEKSLEYLHPKIAVTWDVELNGKFTPRMFTPGSVQEVYWHCPVEGHPSFLYSIIKRRKQNGCQICTGRKVTDQTSVAVKLAEIDVLWHPTKNLPLTPNKVRHKEATKEVWWLCPDCGHKWPAPPHRVIHVGTGCEPCSDKRGARVRIRNKIAKHGSLADLRPDVVAFIDTDRSPEFDPTLVTVGSNDEVYFRCNKCGYAWPNKRPVKELQRVLKSHNCIESLSQRYPEASAFWDTDRNADVPPDNIKSNNREKHYWRCGTCGFAWIRPSNIRNFRRYGLKSHDCSSILEVAFPDVVKFWDWERNTSTAPNQVTAGGSDKIFLQCGSCGYKWPNAWRVSDVTRYGLVCKKCRASFVGRLPRPQAQPAG